MKSKYIFEESDFKSGGQMVIRQSFPEKKLGKAQDFYKGIALAYQVGYLTGCDPGEDCILLISLSDGAAIPFESDSKLCKHLNNDEIGFRPMTPEEISGILGAQGNRF